MKIVSILCSCILFSASLYAAEAPQPKIPEKRPLSVLVYFGLYTQHYRIEEALSGMGKHEIKISNARTDGADYFPASEAELASFDVIVLSDVNYDSIKSLGVDIISRFVEQGGGLLVLGGPFAYGEGDYEKTHLSKILPLELAGPFDLKWEKEGLAFRKQTAHKILEGVDLTASPMVYWIHEAKPKGGTILSAGERPLLVLGPYGKGRVAAFLGTPLGNPGEGQTPFWEWAGWEKLLQNTLGWLAAGEKGAAVAVEEKEPVLVFSEDFEKAQPGASLASLGWDVRTLTGTEYSVAPDHSLKIVHTTEDYKGDMAKHPVPPIKKGAMEFDVKLGSKDGGWFSLQVLVAGKNTAFTDGLWKACESTPSPTGDQWTRVGKVPMDEWHHLRVEFDLTSKFPALRFFMDGQFTGMTSAEPKAEAFTEVHLGDYGLTSGRVVNYVDNIKVYRVE